MELLFGKVFFLSNQQGQLSTAVPITGDVSEQFRLESGITYISSPALELMKILGEIFI